MSMRIAYLTGEYPRATDTFIQREVAALRTLGFEIETCSIRRTGSEHHVGHEQRQEAARTFHVLETTMKPGQLFAAHYQAFKESPSRFFKALTLALRTSPGGIKPTFYQLIYFAEAVVLAKHLKTQKISHLHNHIAKSSCTVAMLASALSGIPFSFTLHGPDIFYEPIHWHLDEKIKRSAFVACISDFCRSQAMIFSTSENWHKLQIVHCGVDPERYSPVSRSGEGKLLFVGRLAAVKGLPILLEALNQLNMPNLTLTIVGDGPENAELKKRTSQYGLEKSVRFLGYRSQSEVAELLKQTNLLVLPSFAEGVPVVLMEAMAAEVPVIATRIAGIPELIQDQVSGILVSPGNVNELANAIKEITEDKQKAMKMGKKGRKKVVEEFDSYIEAARLSQLFLDYAKSETPHIQPKLT